MFKPTIAALLFAASIPAVAATAFKAEVSGAGQPVILIPGLASSGEVWKETAAHLCGPRQCHVLTLAGFAGQPALQEGELIATAEQQLADYITANKLDKPIFEATYTYPADIKVDAPPAPGAPVDKPAEKK